TTTPRHPNGRPLLRHRPRGTRPTTASPTAPRLRPPTALTPPLHHQPDERPSPPARYRRFEASGAIGRDPRRRYRPRGGGSSSVHCGEFGPLGPVGPLGPLGPLAPGVHVPEVVA